MIKRFCEHCKNEMADSRTDYEDYDIETLNNCFRVDLCKNCRDELAKKIDKIVIDFCEIKNQ